MFSTVAAAILSMIIVPQLSYGQIPTSSVQQPNSNQPQCLDFNQDKVCEFMVLANGTTVRNPNLDPAPTSTSSESNVQGQPQSVQEQQQMTESILPPGGKCLGFQTSPTFCKFIQMPNGDKVLNTDWTSHKFSVAASGTGYDYWGGGPRPTQTSSSNNDDEDQGEPETDQGADTSTSNPYCDKLDDSSVACWDRYDYDEGIERTTGEILYPCNDGTTKNDPLDCKDASGYDYDSSNNDEGDNDKDNDGTDDSAPRELKEGEEIHVGEAVQGYQDDDGERVDKQCFENNDGSLGDPVPC